MQPQSTVVRVAGSKNSFPTTSWSAPSPLLTILTFRDAVTKGLEPACLFCKIYPKHFKGHFCSQKCGQTAEAQGPMLLDVPATDPKFADSKSSCQARRDSARSSLSRPRTISRQTVQRYLEGRIRDQSHAPRWGCAPSRQSYDQAGLQSGELKGCRDSIPGLSVRRL